MKLTELFYVTEMHEKDVQPKKVMAFLNKYRNQSTKGLYVRFVDIKDYSTLDKRMVREPDHTNPVGTYAYPMDYVLNHFYDIQYGRGSKSMLVIRDKSSNKLDLGTIKTQDQVVKMLSQMGLNSCKKIYQMADDEYQDEYGITAPPARLLMYILGAMPNMLQTKRLIRLGYDAVEDKSTTEEEAAVHINEPEQIIFLKRSAYEIVEVVDADVQRTDTTWEKSPDLFILHDFFQYTKKLGARIANDVFEGDKLTSTAYEAAKRSATGDWVAFVVHTKSGVEIQVTFKWDDAEEKLHRQVGRHPDVAIEVHLVDQYDEDLFGKWYPPGTTIERIIADIKKAVV